MTSRCEEGLCDRSRERSRLRHGKCLGALFLVQVDCVTVSSPVPQLWPMFLADVLDSMFMVALVSMGSRKALALRAVVEAVSWSHANTFNNVS